MEKRLPKAALALAIKIKLAKTNAKTKADKLTLNNKLLTIN